MRYGGSLREIQLTLFLIRESLKKCLWRVLGSAVRSWGESAFPPQSPGKCCQITSWKRWNGRQTYRRRMGLLGAGNRPGWFRSQNCVLYRWHMQCCWKRNHCGMILGNVLRVNFIFCNCNYPRSIGRRPKFSQNSRIEKKSTPFTMYNHWAERSWDRRIRTLRRVPLIWRKAWKERWKLLHRMTCIFRQKCKCLWISMLLKIQFINKIKNVFLYILKLLKFI